MSVEQEKEEEAAAAAAAARKLWAILCLSVWLLAVAVRRKGRETTDLL